MNDLHCSGSARVCWYAKEGFLMLTKIGLLLICPFILVTVVSLLTTVSFAGTLVEDFDDGDTEGWERSPQNEDNDDVFWAEMT